MKVITEIQKRKIPIKREQRQARLSMPSVRCLDVVKIPIVRVDKSLNSYDDKILFPDKLEKANEMLRKIGLPKQWVTEKHQV